MSLFSQRRYQFGILILFLVVLGTVGFSFVLRPALESFRQARNERAEVETDYTRLAERLNQLRQLEGQRSSANAADLEKLRTLFLGGPEIAYVTNVMARHAQTARFLLTTLEVGGGKADIPAAGPLQEVRIQAQFKGGGYRELKELLKLLTTSVPLFDVTSFTFDPRNVAVSMNLRANRIAAPGTSVIPLDPSFFADPRFTSLSSPTPLPAQSQGGRDNPFTPLPTTEATP